MATFFEIIPAFQQFVDSSGNPISGGTIETFAAGTSTPKVTYRESDGATSNGSSITLDSNGNTPYGVWGTTGAYKIVLKNALGSTIRTRDNVVGINDFDPAVSHSFKANKNATDQTGVLSATYTKVTFGTEVWDTSNWYDTGTSRYTPLIAGIYRINARVFFSGVNVVDQERYTAAIYKNGTTAAEDWRSASGVGGFSTNVETLISMNGSTDYLEAFCYGGGAGNKTISGNILYSYFTGSLVEAT